MSFMFPKACISCGTDEVSMSFKETYISNESTLETNLFLCNSCLLKKKKQEKKRLKKFAIIFEIIAIVVSLLMTPPLVNDETFIENYGVGNFLRGFFSFFIMWTIPVIISILVVFLMTYKDPKPMGIILHKDNFLFDMSFKNDNYSGILVAFNNEGYANKFLAANNGFEKLPKGIMSNKWVGLFNQTQNPNPKSKAEVLHVNSSKIIRDIESIIQNFGDYLKENKELLERDKYHIDPDIPPKKLAKATKKYAQIPNDEKILLLMDDTLFGSATEGFIITTKKIYSHRLTEKPRLISLSEIETVAFETRSSLAAIIINHEAIIEIVMGQKILRQLYLMIFEPNVEEDKNTVNLSQLNNDVNINQMHNDPYFLTIQVPDQNTVNQMRNDPYFLIGALMQEGSSNIQEFLNKIDQGYSIDSTPNPKGGYSVRINIKPKSSPTNQTGMYCRICGKSNATAFKVGPMEFFVCNQSCANNLYNTVVQRGISAYSNMAHLRENNNSYFCMWCGREQPQGINTCSCGKSYGDACKLAEEKLK